jgi:methyltransferase (TIGR00027 family)
MHVKHVSHTAHWMAYLRAVESERPHPLFHDPFARKLAGPFGEETANEVGSIETVAHAIAIRTAILDRLILDTVAKHDIDMVLNLGSGLDTRPWRLSLPAELRWRDVDLPELLLHKARVLANDQPKCRYESLPANILNPTQRGKALEPPRTVSRMLVVTEGLLVYLRPRDVEMLAVDLHQQPACQWWLTDLVGPRVLPALRGIWAARLPALGFHFAPADSPEFFVRMGWREVAFHSSREEARSFKRPLPLPWFSGLGLMLATPSFREEFRRLAGVASFARVDEIL